jgi:hypothetical protein
VAHSIPSTWTLHFTPVILLLAIQFIRLSPDEQGDSLLMCDYSLIQKDIDTSYLRRQKGDNLKRLSGEMDLEPFKLTAPSRMAVGYFKQTSNGAHRSVSGLFFYNIQLMATAL